MHSMNNEPVKAYRGNISLKTYKIGLCDREPPLIRELNPRRDPIYPYTTQELITEENNIQKYKAVFLENNYLKITILPSLNGRLYSAYDKVNKNELFYMNRAIKPALFALRGAWPAVGVEFNFPNSHTTTTMEEVSCHLQNYSDGSASVIIRDIECTCRMTWSVEIILSPSSNAIKMISRLHNPTDFPERYYYWINAACPVYPNTEFIYPQSVSKLLTHPPMDASQLGYLDYPIHNNTDIRFFKNIKQHLPLFVDNLREDYYGIYHHDKNYGLAHVADHSLVRGRKIWTFGTARDGRIFIDQLSDEKIDYCELQTGPFPLQSDYRLLSPGGVYTQNDFWLPVIQTNGFNIACKQFAANVRMDEILLCATENLKNLAIYIDDKKVSSLNVSPGETISVPNKIKKGNIIFCRENGEILAVYKFKPESPKPENEHISPKSSCNPESVRQVKYLKAKYLEEKGFWAQAEKIYEEGEREKERESTVALARLSLRHGLGWRCKSLLDKLLKIDRNNGEALIYHGLAMMTDNDFDGAETLFSKAANDNAYRKRALLYIAKCAIVRKNYYRALELVSDKNGVLASFCRRKLSLPIKKYFYEFSPLSVGEEYFQTGSCIYPEHVVMEAVCEYIKLRDFEDAKLLLENAVREKSALHQYYLAWLSQKLSLGDEANHHLKTAEKQSWGKHFAFRRETENVLSWAAMAAPEDMTIKYQLACLLAFDGRWNEAAELWKKIVGKYFVDSQRNLGIYEWKIKHNSAEAKNYYFLALGNTAGAKSLLEATELLQEIGDKKAMLTSFDNYGQLIDNDCRVKLAYVRMLLANGDPEKAAELLLGGQFRLCEGRKMARELYVKTFYDLAVKEEHQGNWKQAAEYYLKASEYPENIGIGKPAENQEAECFYYAGKAYKRAHLDEKAKNCFIQGAEEGAHLNIDFFPLKHIVWEASPPSASQNKNNHFRNLCREELE